MTISYNRPPTNPNGSKTTYADRSAARRATERHTGETVTPEAFYALSYEQRKAMRRAADQGGADAKRLAQIEESARKQAEIEATAEHLRRPDNVYHHLIAAWQSKAYRPEIRRKIREYEQLAKQREREIESEMQDKLRQFEVESNPETKLAREHCNKASAGAESDEEATQWARLRGRIDGGAASSYWDEAQAILNARLESIRQRMDEQLGTQATVVNETKATADELVATEELTQAGPVSEQKEKKVTQ